MNRVTVRNNTCGTADAQPLDPLDPPSAGRLKELHVPVLVIVGALDNPEILRAGDFVTKRLEGHGR